MPLREKGRPDDDVRDYIAALAHLGITEREAEVARFIAWHFDNAQIADELRICVSTVKTHVEHILRKLDVDDRGVLAGEVRLLVAAFVAEREMKNKAARKTLRLVRKRKPPKAAQPPTHSTEERPKRDRI